MYTDFLYFTPGETNFQILNILGNSETLYSLLVSCSHLASEGHTAPPCTAVTNQIQVSPLNDSPLYLSFNHLFLAREIAQSSVVNVIKISLIILNDLTDFLY